MLNLETGMEKNRHVDRKLVNSAEFRAGSFERWDGQSDVLVLRFGVGFHLHKKYTTGMMNLKIVNILVEATCYTIYSLRLQLL